MPPCGEPHPVFPDNRLTMFVFFSNKLGCLGSIVVSLLVTGLLLFLIGVF